REKLLNEFPPLLPTFKVSGPGWIKPGKAPLIVKRCFVSRGDRPNYNSASPWCSWIGRWLTGRFLIKADPDIRFIGHRMGPRLFERVLDCVSGTGDIARALDACERRRHEHHHSGNECDDND